MRNIENIDNIICELNDEIDTYSTVRGGFELMSRFTYEI